MDSLLRTWGQHGASRELYVDNAKIYHAKALTLACAALNIRLLHRPPRDPPAGGLIERFFRTVQEQLEAEVRAAALLTLDELNRALAAWLETAYHVHVHSQTQRSASRPLPGRLALHAHSPTEQRADLLSPSRATHRQQGLLRRSCRQSLLRRRPKIPRRTA